MDFFVSFVYTALRLKLSKTWLLFSFMKLSFILALKRKDLHLFTSVQVITLTEQWNPFRFFISEIMIYEFFEGRITKNHKYSDLSPISALYNMISLDICFISLLIFFNNMPKNINQKNVFVINLSFYSSSFQISTLTAEQKCCFSSYSK